MGSENMSHNTLSEQLLELAMKSGAEAAEIAFGIVRVLAFSRGGGGFKLKPSWTRSTI